MKIAFVLQRNFAKIEHALAIHLHNKYGADNFSAYVYTRATANFLKNHPEVKYNPLILDEDAHKRYIEEKLDLNFIKELERKYGTPTLWAELALDRNLTYGLMPREYPLNNPRHSHEEQLRILQVKAKELLKMLEKERPQALISYLMGALGSQLAYDIAKKLGIKTILFYIPGIKNLLALTEDYDRLSYAEETFAKIQNGIYQSTKIDEARRFIAEFRAAPIAYHEDVAPGKGRKSFLARLKFLNPARIIHNIIWIIGLIKKNYDYSDERAWGFIIDRMERKVRELIGYADLYDKPSLDDDYCFHAMSAEPELAIYLWAPFTLNQIDLARYIAKSLPVHYKLYVKDHPTMFGYRTRAFYKELKKIPNVKLIDPKIGSFDLMNKAKLVTTITGTAGWEATVLKKPVITFGDIYYNKLSMVKKCRTMEELPILVKAQLENYEYNEQELINFLAAIMEESVPIDIIDLWYKESDFEKIKNNPGIKALADLLAKKLGLIPKK